MTWTALQEDVRVLNEAFLTFMSAQLDETVTEFDWHEHLKDPVKRGLLSIVEMEMVHAFQGEAVLDYIMHNVKERKQRRKYGDPRQKVYEDISATDNEGVDALLRETSQVNIYFQLNYP